MATKIDWCDETLNPLGHWCLGPTGTKAEPKPCSYCYAQKLAKRKMVKCPLCHDFRTPHTHFEQLEKLEHWKKMRSIFIQSMGDLFHDAVPDEWLEEVFKMCGAVPQHRYLFLTKNPRRYGSDIFSKIYEKIISPAKQDPSPAKYWIGTTICTSADLHRLKELALLSAKQNIGRFISIEPLQEKIDLLDETLGNAFSCIDWVIVGAESGERREKILHKREWVEKIVKVCIENDVPVFLKKNIAPYWDGKLITDLPWEEDYKCFLN